MPGPLPISGLGDLHSLLRSSKQLTLPPKPTKNSKFLSVAFFLLFQAQFEIFPSLSGDCLDLSPSAFHPVINQEKAISCHLFFLMSFENPFSFYGALESF